MPIQTINNGSTQGYQVRVGTRDKAMTKFFAWRKYGGAEKALDMARDAEMTLRKQAGPVALRTGPRLLAPSNNTSGLVGIRPHYAVFSDQPYLYFAVSWSEEGRPRSTSFSAQKHGLIGAVQLAMEKREKATGVRLGLTPRQAWNRMKHLVGGHEA